MFAQYGCSFFTFLDDFLWHLYADVIWHANYKFVIENENFNFLTAPTT